MAIPLPILIPISLVIIILIVVLWVVYSKNKKITNKLFSEKIRFHRYKKGIEALKNYPTNPKKDFESLNQYVRAFFKEYLNLDYNLTYLELKDKFSKEKKPEYAKLSKLMSDINYKGGKRNPKEVKQLIELFSEILDKY